MNMKLSAANVRATLTDCLFKDDEVTNGVPPNDAVTAEGVMARYAFHPERLAGHRQDIASMLSELPDDFKSDGGGGMSFLNACYTKGGEHWGEHPDMDSLFVLGIGAGLAKYPLPRDMWSILPGGMPYITIDSKALESAAVV